VTDVGVLYGRLICGWLGVVDTVSLLPAAGATQAGLAAAVGATSTGGTGCTALVQLQVDNSITKISLVNYFSTFVRNFS